MQPIRLTLFLVALNFMCRIPIAMSMQKTSFTLEENSALQKMLKSTQNTQSDIKPATEFKREHLGKVMSVVGFIKNKKLERNRPPFTCDGPKPLFENFKGGEWVLVPLRRDKRLCAAIFASFLQYEVGSCHLITQKNISESCSTEFSSLILPLTDIYLVKKHFELDEDEKPLEYTYRLETALCAEFEDWFENCPEGVDTTYRNPRSRSKKIISPRISIQPSLSPELAHPNKGENYEILYVRPGFEEKYAPEAATMYSEKSIIEEKSSYHGPLKKNPLFNNYSPRPTRKNSII